MRLGRHFLLREFLRSQTAARAGRTLVNPPDVIIGNLTRLVTEVLDPLREATGGPITVLSGWRPDWLNKMVGGSLTSDHLAGRAADIVAGVSNQALCELIRELNLPVKQCILEFPPHGWVHVSVPLLGVVPKREYLVARKEGAITRYSPWNPPKGE